MEKELISAIREMLKEELEPLKNRMDETYEIVKALEHAAKVNKAEHDKMQNDITHIKGNIKTI
ncbi:MAG: hypothetical protein PWQ37_1709 [Candidatus Petromonas sp.]|jgi:hypothetical protein|nr:hypothetical protein [Candidatus Petromonas sp.]